MSYRLTKKTGPGEQPLGCRARPNAQSKFWVFFSRLDDAPTKTEDVKFLIYQAEKHPATGSHYQGYVEYVRKLRANEAASALGFPIYPRNTKVPSNSEGKLANYGMRIRLGTQTQAIRYCSSTKYCRKCHGGDAVGFPCYAQECIAGCDGATDKYRIGETVIVGQPSEDMTFNSTQIAIVADVKAGKRKREIYEDYPGFSRPFWRWIDRQFELYAPVRDFVPGVFWLCGPTGCGKSRLAKAVSTDTYFKGPDSKWFDGYDGQSCIVINDMRKSTFSFSYLLELLDRYPLRVETKGGSTQLVNKIFVITCSKPPEELWSEISGTANEHVDQLTRRMTRVVMFPIETEAKHLLLKAMRIYIQYGVTEIGDAEFGSWTPGQPIPGVAASIDGDTAAGPDPAPINMALDTRAFPSEGDSEAETLQLGFASLTI